MGIKVRELENGISEQKKYAFFCPGCECGHLFEVPGRTFDGNMECPTISPSVLVNQNDPPSRCHSFVKAGKIQFLSDCFHKLANQTVDLPDF